MDETLIHYTDVEIHQQELCVLSEVNLQLHKGEFVYLVGKVGSGKTSLLKTLYGELDVTAGEAEVLGYRMTSIKRKHIPQLRRKLGIVFQDFRLIDKMNVFDNVAFAMRAVGKPSAVIKKRVPYVLELVGLKDKMKNRPSELSGGEQQRVSLARALVNNPEIIIADEPTGNVDPEMSHEIIELLNEINATGTTVIVVTHEHDLVREFDRRVVVLDHGKIKSDTKDLFVKDDYADDYGDDSGEEENTPDYPDNAVVVPE